MGVVEDILGRMSALANARSSWEQTWEDIATYCLPDAARFVSGGQASYDQLSQEPKSVERGRKRYDDTALKAVDRLSSGIESLVTPQAQKWHGLKNSNPFAQESDEEREYFERLRDYLFTVRYNAASGFLGAHQKALRSAVSLGTGIVFVEGSRTDDPTLSILYSYQPLSQCFIAVNAQGEPDTLYRRFKMSARQMVQMAESSGGSVHDSVRRAAEKNGEQDTTFTIVHAVQPRKEIGSEIAGTARSAPWASFYIDQDNSYLIDESGFYEFPFVVYYWQPVEQNVPYAQSAVMLMMSNIRGLNGITKASLKGLHQFLDPPFAVAHDGVMNRPNLNPGKMNFSAVDANGRLRIQPIGTMQRPDFVQEILQAERNNINDGLYINLFQILLNNPNMTATEAMIRANEKGELLGPAGSRIQAAMSHLVDIEGDILMRAGAMHPGSALAPPESLQSQSYHAVFTSPLDRLRRSQEGLGIQRSLQTALPLMQVDPGVADNFDLDEIVRTVNEIEGAPQKILRTEQERDAIRQQRQQVQQAQQALEMAKTGGDAAKNIVPAMQGMAQLAGLPGMQPSTGPAPQ